MSATPTRLAGTFTLNGVTATAQAPYSCQRTDGSGANWDYLLLQTSQASVAGAFTCLFIGSITNLNQNYTGIAAPAWFTVSAWPTYDLSRSLANGFNPATNAMWVIPVYFNWFYPACTANVGPATVSFDLFGI